MKLIITMAGDGSRFRKAGFDLPKPCIPVKNKTLFAWALESLKNFYQFEFIFITQKAHELRSFVNDSSHELGISNHQVIEVNRLTSGQAETALLAKEFITDPNTPIAVYNIDTYVEPKSLHPKDVKGDGWIPCFRAEGSHWSFARVDRENRAIELAEKSRISDLATIGFYYFSSYALFAEAYANYQYPSGQEHYIAPLYNYLISTLSVPVYVHTIDPSSVHVLGTPEEVSLFAAL